MNDNDHECKTKKRTFGEGSWEHVEPSCVHKDDPTVLVLGELPREME